MMEEQRGRSRRGRSRRGRYCLTNYLPGPGREDRNDRPRGQTVFFDELNQKKAYSKASTRLQPPEPRDGGQKEETMKAGGAT